MSKFTDYIDGFADKTSTLAKDLAYDPDQLDRAVVTPDQIRTVVRTYKEKVLSEIFPGRTWVPKIEIFI